MGIYAQVLINKCIIYKSGPNSNRFDHNRRARGMEELLFASGLQAALIYFNRQFFINSAAGMGLAMP